ncbi:MAG: hypothetical protein IPM69_07140 [Ignavibacteria bacterium]|nr:hypothetical protein [Ignavibacteria bacterium]
MKLLLLVILFLTPQFLTAQDTLRGDYRVILQANLGLSQSHIVRTTEVDKAEYSPLGFLRTLRLIWRPDHLLGMGVETGILRVSNLIVKQDASLPTGTTLELDAIPALLIFSMEKYGIEITSGVGMYNYRVNAALNDNEITASTQWEIGWMLGVGYAYPISRSFSIGGDFRYYAIPERQVSLTSLNAKVQWQLWY